MGKDYYNRQYSRRRSPSPDPRRRRSRSRSPARDEWRERDRYSRDRRDYDDRYQRRDSITDRRVPHSGRGHSRGESWASSGDRDRDPSRRIDERRASMMSPLSATRSQAHQPFIKEPISAVSEPGSLGSSPMKMSRPHSVAPQPQVPPAVEATRTPENALTIVPQVPVIQIDIASSGSKSADARIDSLLGLRRPSEKEKAFINDIWNRRISSLAQIQDILAKRGELEVILQEIIKSRPTSDSPELVTSVTERLKTQIQKADGIFVTLSEELLADELGLENRDVGDESLEQRLKLLENSAKDLKDKVGGLDKAPLLIDEVAEAPKPKEAGAKGKDTLKGNPMSDTQLESFKTSLLQLENDLDDFNAGFDAEEFEDQVKNALDELKAQGVFNKPLERQISLEDEKVLDELEAELVAAETWAEELDAKMAARTRATNAWKESFNLTLQAIETGEKTLQAAKKNIEVAETRLSGVKISQSTIQGDDATARSLAEEVYVEAKVQVEQAWRARLESSREEARKGIDKPIDDFLAKLEREDAEEKIVWQQRERDIFIEMADALRETIQFQDAVVEWLKAGNREPAQTR